MTARRAPVMASLIMNGLSHGVHSQQRHCEIRSRERNGLIDLPRPFGLRPGERVRILRGPFSRHLALYAGMRSRERVEVLLRLLGGERRIALPKG
jgi:hypothetical protein